MLQLLGDNVPMTHYRGFALGPHRRTSVRRYPLPPLLCEPVYSMSCIRECHDSFVGVAYELVDTNLTVRICKHYVGLRLPWRGSTLGLGHSPQISVTPARPTLPAEDKLYCPKAIILYQVNCQVPHSLQLQYF